MLITHPGLSARSASKMYTAVNEWGARLIRSRVIETVYPADLVLYLVVPISELARPDVAVSVTKRLSVSAQSPVHAKP